MPDSKSDKDESQVKAEDVLAKDEPGSGSASGISQKGRRRTSNALIENLQTTQGKTITAAISSVVVVALLFFLAITPAVSSITRQLDTNKKLEERNTKLESKLQQLLQLAQKEEQYAQDLESFNELFDENLHQDAIYDEVTNISQLTRMEFRGLTFNPNTSLPAKYNDLEIDERLRFQSAKVSVYGQFGNMDNFLLKLEESKRILDIQDITVTSDEQNPGSVRVDVTINTIFWEIPEE